MARRKGGKYATDLFGDQFLTVRKEWKEGMETGKLREYIERLYSVSHSIRNTRVNDADEFLSALNCASGEIDEILHEMCLNLRIDECHTTSPLIRMFTGDQT